MGKLRIGKGKASIVMDDVMDQIFRRAINNAQPGLLPELERAVDELELAARSQWPVKTGASRAALDSGVRLIGSTGIEAFVINTADHSPYIRAKNLGNKSPYQVLIRRPGIKRGKELAETLGDKLARILTGQD